MVEIDIKPKVYVTGANGFIGREILRKGLENFNSFKWVPISRNHDCIIDLINKYRLEFIKLDLHNKNDSFTTSFSNNDLLIHCAWGFFPMIELKEHLSIELEFQKKFIKNCFEKGLRKLCILGTCYEYGKQEGCMIEDVNTSKPIIPYAIAKFKLYEWIKNNLPEMELTWLRLFYVYGKGQKSLIAEIEKLVKDGKKFFFMTKGDQIRDYLTVDEASEKILKISLIRKNLGVVNICSGQKITVLELVNKYIKENNLSIIPVPGHYNYKEYEPFAYWGSTEKYNKIIREYYS